MDHTTSPELSPLAERMLEQTLQPGSPTAPRAGGEPGEVILDEPRLLEAAYRAAEVERKRVRAVQEFERTGGKLAKVTGSRPKRRKRELKALRDLFEPTLTERRGQAREDRRERRAYDRLELRDRQVRD